MMLFRIKGTKSKKVATLGESNSVDENGFFIWVDKKTYYIKADSFENASKKSKKILDHIHEVKQIVGEFVDI